MRVTFGKTAYVAGCGNEMLDAIENYSGMNPTMTGESLVMYGFSDLEDGLSDRETDDGLEPVEIFLIDAIKTVRQHEPDAYIGDIIFTS